MGRNSRKPGNGGSFRGGAELDPPVPQFPAVSPHSVSLSISWQWNADLLCSRRPGPDGRARGDENEGEEIAGTPGSGGSFRGGAELDSPVPQFPAVSPHSVSLSI